jgi:hypothetical protein
MSRSRSSIESNFERINSFGWSESVSATSRVLKSLRYFQVEMKFLIGKGLQLSRSLESIPMKQG